MALKWAHEDEDGLCFSCRVPSRALASLTLIMKLFFCCPGPSFIDFFFSGKWIQCLQGQWVQTETEEHEGDYRYFIDGVDIFRLLFILYYHFKGLCFGMSRFSANFDDVYNTYVGWILSDLPWERESYSQKCVNILQIYGILSLFFLSATGKKLSVLIS